MLMMLLFELDSEHARLLKKQLEGLTGSSTSLSGPGEGKNVKGLSFMGGEQDENYLGHHKGSDLPVSALGYQEDIMQPLKGLTKKGNSGLDCTRSLHQRHQQWACWTAIHPTPRSWAFGY